MPSRTFFGLAGIALGLGLISPRAAAAPDLSDILNKPVVIENATTKRYLLSTGDPSKATGAEGGWTNSPAVVGADNNYDDRAVWQITPKGEGYVLENTVNKRLLFSTGDELKKAGAEGGWAASPKVVGADANYYDRAIWKIERHGAGFSLVNQTTKRLLFSEGAPIKGVGVEGGWTSAPRILAADDNYYDRAVWTISGFQGPLGSEDDKTLYSLGYSMGTSLKNFALTPRELELVRRGETDSVSGANALVPIDTYRPKVQEMAKVRGKALADVQRQKDRPLLDQAAAAPQAEKLADGVIVQQLTSGSGPSPGPSDSVKVSYEGRLLSDGTIFDSSIQRGQPATFALRGVVKCWSEGLQKMKVGEKARIVCPSDTAYGDQGHSPKIPGGAALAFEVTLLEVIQGKGTSPTPDPSGTAQ